MQGCEKEDQEHETVFPAIIGERNLVESVLR